MSGEFKKSPAEQLADQIILKDLVDISRTETARSERLYQDNIAYLRLPCTTVSIGDYYNPEHPKDENSVVGDFEIDVINWIDGEHEGYGPHSLTKYKLFTSGDLIKAKRIFNMYETNGDPREELIEPVEAESPESSLARTIMEDQVFMDLLPQSGELLLEGFIREVGGDPEETALGLHELTQSEAEDLKKLLRRSSPTRDPYFED